MTIDPSRYVVRPDSTIEDVDLDNYEVHLCDGSRLTDHRADELARAGVDEARRRNLVPPQGVARR